MSQNAPAYFFAADGEVFDLEGIKHLTIGGAYSVDKQYRLERGYSWWADEQPSEKIKAKVAQTLDQVDWKVDVVLSHTCPFRYEPREAFLPFIDQSTVDDSTEKWLDTIEEKLAYQYWFCGHLNKSPSFSAERENRRLPLGSSDSVGK